MKPIISAVIFFFVFFISRAQADSKPEGPDSSVSLKIIPFTDKYDYASLSPLIDDGRDANSIQLDASLQLNSNAVLSTFAGAFLTRKFIGQELINRVLSYAPRNIKYEDDIKLGLMYKHAFKKGMELYFGYYTRNTRHLITDKDAFKLIFEGNAPFENQTASLNNINFENLMYNQYSLGISKTDGHFLAGIILSYLQGYNDNQLMNPSGSLYTAPYGEYLNLNYDLNYNQATPGASKFFDLNGQGISADLRLEYSTPNWRVGLTIQDLGYISWKKSPVNYIADTSFTYSGINISNFTNISGSGINGLNLDSVISALGPHKMQHAYNTTLPATIQLTFSRAFKLKKLAMVLSAGLNTKLLNDYYAYGYLKASFFLGQKWVTSVSAGGGGYSLFNLGWDVGKRWRNFDFILGSDNLIGSLLPMYYPGCSLYLRVAAHF